MNILVTGGTGFIGSNLINRLLELGHKITTTGLESENPVPKGVVFSNLNSSLNQDVCFHQAANNNTLDQDVESMFKVNVYDSMNLFNNLYENGCKKFIYASSTAVYGNSEGPYKETTKTNPLNPYAESKLKFDEFAMNFANKKDVSVIALRYCNVYGPKEEHKGKRSSMIFQIYKQMINNQRPKIFKYGEQKRDWCYVKDVVDANIKCLDYNDSAIFNIGSGKSTSFSRVVQIINNKLKTNLIPEYIDCDFLERYQNKTECDISKAKMFLKWNPKYNIEDGIEDYINLLNGTH